MPKLGLTMTEALLVEWGKQEGEWIKKGEILFTLESEKTTLEIESPASGFLRILVSAGEVVPVKEPVAVISESEWVQVLPAKDEVKAVSFQEEQKSSVQVLDGSPGLRATPMARQLAREIGASLDAVVGSGPRRMIVKSDVENSESVSETVKATPLARRLAEKLGVDPAGIIGSGPRGVITREDVERQQQEMPAAVQSFPSSALAALPLTGLRGLIAERLSAGWNERPQVTLVAEADASNLVSARQQINAERDQKVSFNAFLVLAAAKALEEQPNINVILTEEGMVRLDEINIGMAVDTERGLLVPVLKEAEGKDIFEVDQALAELAQRALEGRSLPDELSGGTFTVTNLGAFGIDAFTPIINPPEAAILGVGQIAPSPVVVDGQLAVRDTVTLSLSFDHRLIDGVPAAKFLQRLVQLIERPMALLV
jgi:pyruvate dehydrogenase E2 component (dihydrolipoamide acetyltransferase)